MDCHRGRDSGVGRNGLWGRGAEWQLGSLSLKPKNPVHSDHRRAPAGECLQLVIGQPASVRRRPPSLECQPPSVKRILPPLPSGRPSCGNKRKKHPELG